MRAGRDRASRLFRLFLLTLLCLLTASASFHGFYSKWGMREDEAARFGLQAMFEGTAERPWAYRQLMPATATAIDGALPASLKEKVTPKLVEMARALHFKQEATAGPALATQPAYALRYYLVYFMAFGALLCAMPLLIRLPRGQGISFEASLVAAIFFMLLFPVLETIGGYYYDLGELFFMAAYLLLLPDRRWRWLCIPLAVIASINKESFLFFIVTTAPLCLTWGGGLSGLLRDRAGIAVTALAATASAVTHALMLAPFAGNPGGETQFWLGLNIPFYANPLNLLGIETSYGVPLFAGYSIVTLALFAGVAAFGLPRLDTRTRAYVGFAALVNVPLLLLFAWPGEMRNLSFLFLPGLLCLAATFDRLLFRPQGA